MSMSFGSQQKKGSSSSTTNPWGPTIPALTDLVNQLGNYSQTNVGPTSAQSNAFSQLEANAAQGNPNTANIQNLANDQFNAQSRSGQVEDAYGTLQSQIGDTAAGKYLDVNENPYLQKVMQTTGDDIFNRIGSQFAAAGRNITGNAAGQQAAARGIEAGLAPTLFNQYNTERQNQMGAANSLFQGGTGAAQTEQGLDQNALATRQGGIATGQAALDAQNYAPNTILNLEQQMKNMPAQDLASYVQLLGSIAGLGGQATGTSKQSGTSFGVGANDVLGGIGAIAGALPLLSDERMKEDKVQIGTLANGTPIYRFKYKKEVDPSQRTQIGVMAQDVEQDSPEAVSEVGGVKFVDVDAATDDAARKMRRKKDGGGRAYS